MLRNFAFHGFAFSYVSCDAYNRSNIVAVFDDVCMNLQPHLVTFFVRELNFQGRQFFRLIGSTAKLVDYLNCIS